MGTAALFLLLFIQQDGEASVRPARTDRNWSLWVHLEACDREIERVDTMRVDIEDSPVTTTAGQLLIFQWNTPSIGPADNLASVLIEMSRTRYKARIFYRDRTGGTGVTFLYFSPYGAARHPIEAVSGDSYAEGDEGRPIPRIKAWMGTHDFSPRSAYNPGKSAFDTEFGRLARRFDARMEMTIRLGSCPAQESVR